MRFVALSDHPSVMLAEARRQRESAQGPEEERHRAELAVRQSWIDEARQRRDQAPNPLVRLRWAVTAWWRRFAPAPRPAQAPSHGEEAIMGGIKGEREVADALHATLGNAWTLVKGYRNRRGEIDYVLLGPGGLFAIEVKYVNGTFAITRERWRYTRYDNYGNSVAEGLLADARGRPPGVQLGEPLAMLEQFLASRGHQVRMRAVVLLNHPKARISSCAPDVGVVVLTATAQLQALIRESDGQLAARRLAEIERLIVRDHRYHEERHQASRGKPAAS